MSATWISCYMGVEGREEAFWFLSVCDLTSL